MFEVDIFFCIWKVDMKFGPGNWAWISGLEIRYKIMLRRGLSVSST